MVNHGHHLQDHCLHQRHYHQQYHHHHHDSKCSDDDLANVWENDRQTLWLLSRSFAGSNNINSSWIMINDGVHCHFRALSLPWLSNQGMIDDWKGDKPPGIIMGNPAGSSSWTRLSLHDTRAVKLCPRGKSLVNHYHTLGAQRWHHAANIDCFPHVDWT